MTRTRTVAAITIALAALTVGCAPAPATPGLWNIHIPRAHRDAHTAVNDPALGPAAWAVADPALIIGRYPTDDRARAARALADVCKVTPEARLVRQGSSESEGCPTARPATGGIPRQTGAVSYYTERGVLAFSRRARGCAHRTAAPGTVLFLRRGSRTTWCVVDDRGPYVAGRVVDLQPAQFAELGPVSAGVLRGGEVAW